MNDRRPSPTLTPASKRLLSCPEAQKPKFIGSHQQTSSCRLTYHRCSPGMESLPPELRCQVGEYLDVFSLNSLTQVSKGWNDCFSSVLFIKDRHEGRSVLWALAVDNRKLLHTATDYGVTTTARWPQSWRKNHDFRGYTALQICIVRGYQDLARAFLAADPRSAKASAVCRRCESVPPTDRFRHPARGRSLRQPLLHLAVCYSQWPMAKLLLQPNDGPRHMPGPRSWLRETTRFGRDVCSCLFDICRLSVEQEAYDFTEWLFLTGIAPKNLPAAGTSSLGVCGDFFCNAIELACKFGQYRLALLFVRTNVRVIRPPFAHNLDCSLILWALEWCIVSGSEAMPAVSANEYRAYLRARRGEFDHLGLLVKTLLEFDVPVDELDPRTGRTALHLAAMIGDLGVLEPILERSNVAMLNQEDLVGLTPLCLSKHQWRRLPGFAWSADAVNAPAPPAQVGESLVPPWIQPLLRTLTGSMSFDCDDFGDANGAPLRIQTLQTPIGCAQSNGQYWMVDYREDCVEFLHSSGHEALNLSGRDLCFVF